MSRTTSGAQPTTFDQSRIAATTDKSPRKTLKGGFYDSQTGIPCNCSHGARCVQRLDDSQIHANRITFRISLRSSSLQEPRDPLLKVVIFKVSTRTVKHTSVYVAGKGLRPHTTGAGLASHPTKAGIAARLGVNICVKPEGSAA